MDLNLQLKITARNLATRALRGMAKGLTDIRTLALAAGAAITAVFAARVGGNLFGTALDSAQDFEQQMAVVKSLLSGSITDAEALGQAYDRLAEKARELGRTTSFTATQAGAAIEELIRAGQSVDEALGSVQAVLNASISAGISLAESAERITDIGATLQLTFDETGETAQRVVDVVSTLAATTATTFAQASDAITRAGIQAARAGIEFETVAAAVGLLGNSGLRAAEAGTALRNFFQELNNPLSQFSRALVQGGIDTRNFVEVLEAIEDTGGKSGAILQKLTQEARTAAQILLANGTPALKAYIAELQDVEGNAQRVADIIGATLTGAINRFTSSLDDAQRSFADPLLDPLRAQFDQFATELTRFADGGLFSRLGETLSDSLRPVFDELNAAIASFDVEGFEQRVGRFLRNIPTLARSIVTGLSDVGSAAASVANSIGLVVDLVQASFNGIAALGTLIALKYNEATKAVAEFGDALPGIDNSDIIQNAEANIDSLTESLDVYSERARQNIDSVRENFRQLTGDTQGAAEAQAAGLLDLRDGLRAVSEEVRENATAQAQAQNALARFTQDVTEQRQKLLGFREELNRLSDAFTQFDPADVELSVKVGGDVRGQLDELLAQVQQFAVDASDEANRAALEAQAASIQVGIDNIDRLQAALSNAVGAGNSALAEQINRQLSGAFTAVIAQFATVRREQGELSKEARELGRDLQRNYRLVATELERVTNQLALAAQAGDEQGRIRLLERRRALLEEIGEIEQGIVTRNLQAAEETQRQIEEQLTASFQRLGIRSQEQIRAVIDNYRQAFEFVQANSADVEDQNRAFLAFAKAQIEASKALGDTQRQLLQQQVRDDALLLGVQGQVDRLIRRANRGLEGQVQVSEALRRQYERLALDAARTAEAIERLRAQERDPVRAGVSVDSAELIELGNQLSGLPESVDVEVNVEVERAQVVDRLLADLRAATQDANEVKLSFNEDAVAAFAQTLDALTTRALTLAPAVDASQLVALREEIEALTARAIELTLTAQAEELNDLLDTLDQVEDKQINVGVTADRLAAQQLLADLGGLRDAVVNLDVNVEDQALQEFAATLARLRELESRRVEVIANANLDELVDFREALSELRDKIITVNANADTSSIDNLLAKIAEAESRRLLDLQVNADAVDELADRIAGLSDRILRVDVESDDGGLGDLLEQVNGLTDRVINISPSVSLDEIDDLRDQLFALRGALTQIEVDTTEVDEAIAKLDTLEDQRVRVRVEAQVAQIDELIEKLASLRDRRLVISANADNRQLDAMIAALQKLRDRRFKVRADVDRTDVDDMNEALREAARLVAIVNETPIIPSAAVDIRDLERGLNDIGSIEVDPIAVGLDIDDDALTRFVAQIPSGGVRIPVTLDANTQDARDALEAFVLENDNNEALRRILLRAALNTEGAEQALKDFLIDSDQAELAASISLNTQPARQDFDALFNKIGGGLRLPLEVQTDQAVGAIRSLLSSAATDFDQLAAEFGENLANVRLLEGGIDVIRQAIVQAGEANRISAEQAEQLATQTTARSAELQRQLNAVAEAARELDIEITLPQEVLADLQRVRDQLLALRNDGALTGENLARAFSNATQQMLQDFTNLGRIGRERVLNEINQIATQLNLAKPFTDAEVKAIALNGDLQQMRTLMDAVVQSASGIPRQLNDADASQLLGQLREAVELADTIGQQKIILQLVEEGASPEQLVQAFELIREASAGAAANVEQLTQNTAEAAAAADALKQAQLDAAVASVANAEQLNVQAVALKAAEISSSTYAENAGLTAEQIATSAARAAEFEARGRGIASAIAQAVDSTFALSDAAGRALTNQTVLRDLTRDTSVEAQQLRLEFERFEGDLTNVDFGTSFDDFFGKVRRIKGEFFEQRLEVQRLEDDVNAMADSGVVDQGRLRQAVAATNASFDRLDATQLNGLRAAVARVTSEVRRLRDEAEQTLATLERRRAGLEGRESDVLAIDQATERLELEEQLNRARAFGDQQAIDTLTAAIRELDRIQLIERQNLANRTAGNNTVLNQQQSQLGVLQQQSEELERQNQLLNQRPSGGFNSAPAVATPAASGPASSAALGQAGAGTGTGAFAQSGPAAAAAGFLGPGGFGITEAELAAQFTQLGDRLSQQQQAATREQSRTNQTLQNLASQPRNTTVNIDASGANLSDPRTLDLLARQITQAQARQGRLTASAS